MDHLLSLYLFIFLLLAMVSNPLQAQPDTYAEKLGYPEDTKVLIMHVDDAGMSWGSNKGTRDAIEKGVANSFSIMMPCPWVPGIAKYVKDNPRSDAGLHLTLTSEWDDYRWGPLMGKPAVPGLVDKEGCFWGSVDQVVEHASPDEVEAEIRAQVERALTMGFRPTHLDSHMGTLFADRAFLERYIKVGADYNIPVMFPGGHISFLKEDYRQETMRELKESGEWKEGIEVPAPDMLDLAPEMGQKIWSMGLPVLDDLHNVSYGWEYPGDENPTDEQLQQFYTDKYIETIDALKPGLMMVIMHCTDPSEIFGDITTSGQRRKGDLLAMTDPRLKRYIEEENIILTTWREVMERRQKINQSSESLEKSGSDLPVKDFVFEKHEDFEQAHASTIAKIDDEEFIVAWFGGTEEKHDDVGIWISTGKPGEWSEPRELVKVREDPHWNPVLFKAPGGEIILYFKVGKEIPEWETWVTTSSDGGITWSEARELVPGDKGGRGPVKNKPIVLSNGDWLAPASHEGERWRVFVDRSTDNGESWEASDYVPVDTSEFQGKGAIQPTLWESDPGHVHMLVRTTAGVIGRSDSEDYGKTWSQLYKTSLPNPNSGIDLVKLADGTLILAYNPDDENWGDRSPLTLAVSEDNGKTWPYRKDIETGDPEDEFSYPSIIAWSDTAAVVYTWQRRKVAFWSGTADHIKTLSAEEK